MDTLTVIEPAASPAEALLDEMASAVAKGHLREGERMAVVIGLLMGTLALMEPARRIAWIADLLVDLNREFPGQFGGALSAMLMACLNDCGRAAAIDALARAGG